MLSSVGEHQVDDYFARLNERGGTKASRMSPYNSDAQTYFEMYRLKSEYINLTFDCVPYLGLYLSRKPVLSGSPDMRNWKAWLNVARDITEEERQFFITLGRKYNGFGDYIVVRPQKYYDAYEYDINELIRRVRVDKSRQRLLHKYKFEGDHKLDYFRPIVCGTDFVVLQSRGYVYVPDYITDIANLEVIGWEDKLILPKSVKYIYSYSFCGYDTFTISSFMVHLSQHGGIGVIVLTGDLEYIYDNAFSDLKKSVIVMHTQIKNSTRNAFSSEGTNIQYQMTKDLYAKINAKEENVVLASEAWSESIINDPESWVKAVHQQKYLGGVSGN
jgi:hypothetical protein